MFRQQDFEAYPEQTVAIEARDWGRKQHPDRREPGVGPTAAAAMGKENLSEAEQ